MVSIQSLRHRLPCDWECSHVCLSFAAWAHWILYGDEATRQAQQEGEEAAAAYEKEKRDIASGILPAVAPKSEKKKRKPAKKKEDGKEEAEEGDDDEKGEKAGKKKRVAKDESVGGEKKKVKAGGDKESIAPILAKSVGKVRFVLTWYPHFFGLRLTNCRVHSRQPFWPHVLGFAVLVI
jgi:hypothetical protein